jgi:hypothetical protein
LWEFETVNKIAGGARRCDFVGGPVIVGGMMYIGSGYGVSGPVFRKRAAGVRAGVSSDDRDY